tara:strand:+ start:612 stop:1421 length:810 start_codon:yes stop_codon:yes gene_type:complete
MSSLKKFLQIVKIIIKNPRVLGYVYAYNDPQKNYVVKHYGLKNGLPTIDFLDILPEFKETITHYTALSHGSMISDYALLKGLARKFKECRYLEIGTWFGESIVNVASIAKECISLSLSDKELQQHGATKEEISIQGIFLKNLSNVRHIKHNSQTFDFSSIGKFDLIFIDGDHSYEGVKKDTENAFRILKNDNSIIIWHDYSNLTGNTILWRVFAGILDGCPKEKLQNLYHISNTMCAIYINKKLIGIDIPSQIPNKTFTINISSKKFSN